MLHSRTWQYAVRVLLRLATLEPDARVRAEQVAADAGVPPSYASKILSTLTSAGLVASRRGPSGGVMLARPPSSISLADVARAVGEGGAIDDCLLGLEECSDDAPCAAHALWTDVRERLRVGLTERTLDDLRLAAPADADVLELASARDPELDDELL